MCRSPFARGPALALPLPLPAARLDFVQAFAREPSFLDAPQAVSSSPVEAHADRTSAAIDAVVISSRAATTGRLDDVEARGSGLDDADRLSGANGDPLRSDGRCFYVAGTGENSVAVFAVLPEGALVRDGFESGGTGACS